MRKVLSCVVIFFRSSIKPAMPRFLRGVASHHPHATALDKCISRLFRHLTRLLFVQTIY